MRRAPRLADALIMKGAGGKLALVGASLLFCVALLGAAEVFLRLFRPRGLEQAPALQPYVYSPSYGWTLRPGWKGRTRDGRTVAINARGFRGPLPEAAPETARRVLLLGDSITFGTGVDDHETFAAQLAAQAPGTLPLNLGVSGYGTDQELLWLEREGLDLHPAAVVLNVCVGNDILDNALPVYLYDGVTPKPYFTAEGDGLRLHDGHVRLRGPALLARRLADRSLVFDALLLLSRGQVRSPLDHDDGEHWGPRAREVLEEWPQAVALTRRLLRRMSEICSTRAVPFLVLLHPNRRAFEGDDGAVDAFRLPAREGSAPPRVLDLRSVYAEDGLGWADFALDKLGHLSPRGHALVARALARELAN
jgi:lysophospholipase L1-like esterase